ncbi:hypothetical protein N0V93_006872 [Gnomoniopsis smithogilvyi]|uniref:Type II methyltransferase M.TaqI-like domain-containing protein n=1 Tax=Gnomoniopsis smithogilvyi TaxID=1191159 RepID=A0A9W9CV45_9PEZI|nr:hypothetical protein N0V93_006872 [Gnomoniopsis smithogilvyi]
MPRISPSLLSRAYRISPHAATLLPTCRELPSALNELRWIREHVAQQLKPKDPERQVASLCRRRGRGEPLQYVLGSQPFGNLDILCRPGVLIPRPEPEAYTTHLAHLINTHSLFRPLPPSLTIVDLCTGTGCIALLLHSLLARSIPHLHIHGVDISPQAVQLSQDNMHFNIAAKRLPACPDPAYQLIAFSEGDIFSSREDEFWMSRDGNGWDVLVCNPPYISSWGFTHQTERSVRKYEPKLAQVPMVTYPGAHEPEDVFYARLLDIGVRKRAKVMLFEVGDLAQASRVVGMALRHEGLASTGKVVAEIWRDWPDAAPQENEATLRTVSVGEENREVMIRGSGHGRSVFIQCS